MTSSIKRHEAIMELLVTSGEVTVAELSERLQVTGKTIRQDLEKLEAKGLLRRTHGGALPASEGFARLLPVQEQHVKNQAMKQEAAWHALSFIEQNDIIALDSGSTTLQIAKLLDNEPLTVITNDLYIIGELLKKDQIRLVVPGGFRSRNLLVNEDAGRFLGKLNVQKAFLSTTGIHPEYGFTIFTHVHVEQKRALLQAAKQTYCVSDSTKFDQCALMTFAELSEIHVVITDSELPSETAAKYESCGVKVIRGMPEIRK